jgi:signal peptide peptidase SppA
MSWERIGDFLSLDRWRRRPPVVAVVRLEGVIAPRGPRVLSLQRFEPVLARAFAQRRLKAVALAINSPGGSPVQSQLIARRIRQLAAEKDVPVFAFAEDVAASGGYWLALAADEIFVEETSLVGSIGVISAGFGFVEALRRLGVERRLHTAGENKSLLDPFLPEDAPGVERLGTLQRELHDSFKAMVRQRRAGRLKADEETLFTGAVFSGGRAVTHGLVDGVGELRSTMRERFGDKIRFRTFEPERRRLSLFGAPRFQRADLGDLTADLVARLEERLIWARFGL